MVRGNTFDDPYEVRTRKEGTEQRCALPVQVVDSKIPGALSVARQVVHNRG